MQSVDMCLRCRGKKWVTEKCSRVVSKPSFFNSTWDTILRFHRSDLMVKKLRYYARFIVVCLLLKRIKMVRDLVRVSTKYESARLPDPYLHFFGTYRTCVDLLWQKPSSWANSVASPPFHTRLQWSVRQWRGWGSEFRIRITWVHKDSCVRRAWPCVKPTQVWSEAKMKKTSGGKKSIQVFQSPASWTREKFTSPRFSHESRNIPPLPCAWMMVETEYVTRDASRFPIPGISPAYTTVVAWPSGLRRWFKAPVSSGAWVRIPPLPMFFSSYACTPQQLVFTSHALLFVVRSFFNVCFGFSSLCRSSTSRLTSTRRRTSQKINSNGLWYSARSGPSCKLTRLWTSSMLTQTPWFLTKGKDNNRPLLFNLW